MAALLNGTGYICKINHLNRLHAAWQALTQHTDWAHIQGIYDWALLQRIQMKQFSHLIHSHPLFIPLGETETLGLLFSEKRPWNPIYSHEQKGNTMRYSGVKHQGVKTKKKLAGGSVSATRTAMNQQAHCKSNYYKSGKEGKKLEMWKTQNPKCGNFTYWAPPTPPQSRCTQMDWPPSYAVGK